MRYTCLQTSGDTALLIASSKGDVQTINLLLDHGANINEKTTAGVSAVALACGGGHWDAVAALVLRGCALTDKRKVRQ